MRKATKEVLGQTALPGCACLGGILLAHGILGFRELDLLMATLAASLAAIALLAGIRLYRRRNEP